jgi:hypothetical protein
MPSRDHTANNDPGRRCCAPGLVEPGGWILMPRWRCSGTRAGSACRGGCGGVVGGGRSPGTQRSHWPARHGCASGVGPTARSASATRTPRAWRCRRRRRRCPSRAPAPSPWPAGGTPRRRLHPWSAWMIAPAGGVRVWMAMPRASVTSAAVGVASIDRPTTRGAKASSTTAQERVPSRVGARWYRSPQLGRAGPGEVAVDQVGGDLVGLGMAPGRPAGHPARPARRSSRATAVWPAMIGWPSRSSACARRAP